jgi:hypothetical protein
MFVMSPGEFDGGCSCRIFQETRWEPKDYIMDTSNVWARRLRFKKKPVVVKLSFQTFGYLLYYSSVPST